MRQNTEAVYHILEFIFKDEEGPTQAYICRTTSQDLRQVYKNHYTGQNPHTAPWFEMSSPKAPVRMYELESKKMDTLAAYSRYVGWEFFFVDNHYSIANPDFKKNQQYYHPNDIVAYHEIVQNNDLNKLCSEDKDLSTKWHFSETEYNEFTNIISDDELEFAIEFSKEDYEDFLIERYLAL